MINPSTLRRTRYKAIILVVIALGVLVVGSVFCLSGWVPTNLNVTEGPGTATDISLFVWPFVLVAVLLFVTLALRAVRLTRYAPVAAVFGALSWVLLSIVGPFPSSIVVGFFLALNIIAALGAWSLIQYVLRHY